MLEKELKVLTDFHSNGSYETIAQNFKLLDEKDYAYMVRTTDLETNNFSDNVKYMSKSSYEFLSKSKVYGGEVLINKIGSPGRTYLMPKLDMHVSLGMNLFLLRLKGDVIDENTLYLFLNSTVGKNIIQRKVNGTVPLTIDKKAIRSLYAPVFSHEFRKRLNYLMSDLSNISKEANTKYTKAENILISELGLENFNPSSEKVSIKTLKESFLKTGRLDSEYYQPKYDEIEKKLDKIGIERLESICSLINYGTVPTSPYVKSNNSIPYIKGMNLKNCFVVGDLDEIENTDTLQDKFFTKENDIIISQMGTVGDVGIITKEQENYLFASFTIRARLDDDRFNPFFVGAYIQNVAKEYYLYRNIAQASVRQNTDLPTIKNMPIPLVKKEVQDEIADYIKQSMEYSKKAKKLLEIATKSVEIAIDKDETAAHNFLEQNRTEQNRTGANCLL